MVETLLDFEGGTHGSQVTAVTAGVAEVGITTGNILEFSNLHPVSGSLGVRYNASPAGGENYMTRTDTAVNGTFVSQRVWFWSAAISDETSEILEVRDSAGTQRARLMLRENGQIQLVTASGTVNSSALTPTSATYSIRFNVNVGAGTCSAELFFTDAFADTPDETLNNTFPSGDTLVEATLGNITGAAFTTDLFLDAWIANNTDPAGLPFDNPTADAGANKTVASSGAVQVGGTGDLTSAGAAYNGTNLTIAWTQESGAAGAFDSTTVQQPNWTAAVGPYTATLRKTVTDPATNLSDFDDMTVTVSEPPAASPPTTPAVTADPTSVTQGGIIQFLADSEPTNGGTITAWEWDTTLPLSSTTTQNPTCDTTSVDPGDYTVRVRSQDNDGTFSAYGSVTVRVVSPGEPVGNWLELSLLATAPGGSVRFRDRVEIQGLNRTLASGEYILSDGDAVTSTHGEGTDPVTVAPVTRVPDPRRLRRRRAAFRVSSSLDT